MTQTKIQSSVYRHSDSGLSLQAKRLYAECCINLGSFVEIVENHYIMQSGSNLFDWHA